MNEEEFLSKKDPFGESGRPIPPVEDAWWLMRRKLDARLPVSLPRAYSQAAWWSGAGAVVVVTTVTVVFLMSRPANRPLHPNPVRNNTYQGTAKAAGMDSTGYSPVAGKVNTNRTPGAAARAGAALQGNGRNSRPGKDSIGVTDATPAGLAGSASETRGTSNETRGTSNETPGPSAKKADRSFGLGKNPSGRSVGKESTPGHRWRRGEEGGGKPLAGEKQWAEGLVSGRATPAVPAVPEASVVYTGSIVRIEGVTHNLFCRVADSLLRASAWKGRWATTPAGVAEKTKTLPSGNKGSKGKKDRPWEGEGLRMAAGISAGKTFPIGGQEAYAYGANGKKAGLTDYIPQVYFRYYPGKNNYIQVDLAVHSPQYTHSLGIDSVRTGTSTLPGWQSALQYSTVTLKKLYYNDLGISFHYRLFDGLWLGAGMQASQLLNAVGRNDTVLLAPVSGRDTVFGSEIYGMKSVGGDYGELPKIDWRVTLQAQYSWRRWMLSVVFKEAIQTYTDYFLYGYNNRYRNSSWGVFLSYDLWEKKRKK